MLKGYNYHYGYYACNGFIVVLVNKVINVIIVIMIFGEIMIGMVIMIYMVF
jgi:hypothetical protein